MLSVPDIALIGGVALLVFGPEQLPRVARKVGHLMRDVQSTSQQFIREMERAADDHETATHTPYDPAPYESTPYESTPYRPYFDPTDMRADAPPPEPPPPPAPAIAHDPTDMRANPAPVLREPSEY